jgi:16S rRNA (uracil1498-N3)-methyltransferase
MSNPVGPHPALVASAAHVFVADLEHPDLDHDDAHHLSRVLRLRAGEIVTASDGRGSWRECRFVGGPSLDACGEISRDDEPAPVLTVGFGIPKGDRPEWIVQKLTEIGVDRIVPLITDRGVVRWDTERSHKQIDRLRRIAREAACQSRRTWLPVVEALSSAADMFTTPGTATATMGGERLSLSTPTVLVGPEGGWTERELQGSITRVGLGTTVMRVETAALAAGIVLTQQRADLAKGGFSPGNNTVGGS